LLRWAHDHHRNFPTLDAAARAASFSSINRDDDAVTRHVSYLHRAVALLHRPSAHRAPNGSPVSLSAMIPDATTDFGHPWPRITAKITRQDFRNGDRDQAGEHHTRFPQHNQILKSP
jgi:hypothetical protein